MSLSANYYAPDYQWRSDGTGTMVHIFYKTFKPRERNEQTVERRRADRGPPEQPTDIDAKYLKDFFENEQDYFPAGATVACKKLGTFAETKAILKQMDEPEEGQAPGGSSIYEKFDCFFFIFLTFIDTNERLYFIDKTHAIEEILDVVKDLKVARGKPKVFLIQSDDITLKETDAEKAGPTRTETKVVKIPSDADRLIVHSTIPQCLVTGDMEKSLLVQAFVDTIKDNQRASGEMYDFLTLTTILNGKVSKMINRIPDRDKLIRKLPVPLVTSTLTKCLKFHQRATV